MVCVSCLDNHLSQNRENSERWGYGGWVGVYGVSVYAFRGSYKSLIVSSLPTSSSYLHLQPFSLLSTPSPFLYPFSSPPRCTHPTLHSGKGRKQILNISAENSYLKKHEIEIRRLSGVWVSDRNELWAIGKRQLKHNDYCLYQWQADMLQWNEIHFLVVCND